MSWRTTALVLLTLWPQAGCLQLPNLGLGETRPPSPKWGAGQPVKALDKELSVNAPPASTQPSQADAARSLAAHGDALEKGNRPAEAAAVWEQLRQHGGESAVYATRRLALLYDRTGNLDRAEQECLLLKQHNKKDADNLAQLGHINYRLERWPAAQKYLMDAIDNGFKDPQIKLTLGLALAQTKDYVDSMECLKQVVSEPEAYCQIAAIMNKQGKPEDAARAYQTALSLDPTMARARSELAKLGGTGAGSSRTFAFHRGGAADQRGMAELESTSTTVAQADDEHSRRLSPQATLPPLDLDLSNSDWATAKKTKTRK